MTLLFTDIEGSVRLWEADPGAMAEASGRQNRIVREQVEGAGGHVFKTVGEAFRAVFADPAAALASAVAVQRAVGAERWPPGVPVRVRMALHSGACAERAGDYFGPVVNRAARLLAVGHGGQVLVSGAAYELLADRLGGGPGGPRWRAAAALAERAGTALRSLPASLAALPRDEVPLVAWAPVGVAGLRALASGAPPEASLPAPAPVTGLVPLSELVDEIAGRGQGLVMTMGKGGVGKTTLAAAIAGELARRGHAVELTTTDPAAHLDAVTGTGDDLPGMLRVGRTDPGEVTAAYTAEVLATAGTGLEESALAVLEKDLRSPCTEEIAVFRAFASAVAAAAGKFVVLDTAPTGHTLLLLDAARAYHREAGRLAGTVPPEVEALLRRLKDPAFTQVLIVTLPEATPVHEAAALQADLRRAGIEPAAWVVNCSLAAAGVTDPVLAARAAAETRYLQEIRASHASRLAAIPMLTEPPAGPGGAGMLFMAMPAVPG